MIDSPRSGGGLQQPICHEIDQFEHCLYFLVCWASTGDRAGLFKLGITGSLADRHRQHTKVWDGFDLQRSARLRLRNRHEVKLIETILKKRFKKWRRYPGSNDAGYTEFFAVECLDEMLDLAHLHGVLGLDGHLSREIDPQECATKLRAEGMSTLARKQLGEMYAQRNALRRQECAEQGDHITLELNWVHAFAKSALEHLVWVNLEHWYDMPIIKAPEVRKDKTLVDLYFGRFHPAPPDAEPTAGQRPATQASFEMSVQGIQRSAVRTHSSLVSRYCPPPMFYLRKPLVYPGDQLPHPVCADTLLVRVECGRCIPPPSMLAKFMGLAQQVGSLPRWEQQAFDL